MSAVPDPAPPVDLPAWQALPGGITTSGYLTAAALPGLAAAGTRHVINLALADHPRALPDAAAQLALLGISYTHIPVQFDAPDEAQFARFCAAMASAPRPLHVHCIANWRVSAFLYRYHCAVAGMDPAEARTLMVQQWDPDTHDHPDAPAWARFIAASPLANP